MVHSTIHICILLECVRKPPCGPLDRVAPTSPTDQPVWASKLSAELVGRTYSHLYGITFVALRLFHGLWAKTAAEIWRNN